MGMYIYTLETKRNDMKVLVNINSEDDWHYYCKISFAALYSTQSPSDRRENHSSNQHSRMETLIVVRSKAHRSLSIIGRDGIGSLKGKTLYQNEAIV